MLEKVLFNLRRSSENFPWDGIEIQFTDEIFVIVFYDVCCIGEPPVFPRYCEGGMCVCVCVCVCVIVMQNLIH